MEICKDTVERWVERVRHETHEFFNKVREVCHDLPWPLSWICDTVVDVVEVITVWFEDIVHEVVKRVCKVVDFIVEIGAKILGVILSIPIIGPILKWVLGGVEFVVNQVGGLVEGIAGLLGWLPRKVMDLHVFVLRDSDGPLIAEDALGPVVAETKRIYWDRARVDATITVHMLETIAPDYAFHIDADGGLFGEDLTMAGTYFQSTMTLELGASVTGLFARRPAPVAAFVVKGVGTSQTGCSLGPLADWVVVEPAYLRKRADGTVPNTLAHEVAHACGLAHTDDITNLIHPQEDDGARPPRYRGDNLSPFQRMVVRNSSHVAF